MPFGMKTAPATFQKMMRDRVLPDLESFPDASGTTEKGGGLGGFAPPPNNFPVID